MTSHTCQYYDGTETVEGCSAPLCPMDEKSIAHGSWFPGEEVCRRRTVPNWVHKQRALVSKKSNPAYCWTVKMLCKIGKICQGAEGINPDHNPKTTEAAWLDRYKGAAKREYSEEQRRIIAERFLKGRSTSKKSITQGESETSPADPIQDTPTPNNDASTLSAGEK